MSGSVLRTGRSVLVPDFDGDVHKMTVHRDAHSDGEGGMGNCGGLMVRAGQLNHLGSVKAF